MLASAPEWCEELTSGTSYSPPPAFGRFKLLHQIGAGVLGPVFRTHDPDHDRLVAVKAFTLDLTPEQASTLSAEFERIASLELDAPCVAGPLAAGVEDFVPYVAVPYVPGESLDAAIRQYGPAPVGDAIRLIGHVADALDAAAHVGVFHGSLHPRDIIVTPGETHVTGMGVAQALELVGLHGPIRRPYVAPEREGGDGWGPAADIYSLAAIAYEVLTGRRALPGTDQPLSALADIHVHGAAVLREVIESALDPDAGRRPACARDFAVAVAAALSDSAAPGEAGERAADRRPRKPRARPPKLPGLDEPLQSQENTGRGRARAGAPVAAVPATPEEALAPAGLPQSEAGTLAGPVAAGPGAATGDIRYVPVTDPMDAGDSWEDLEPRAASPAEAPIEPLPGPVVEPAPPDALGPSGAGLTAGPAPDLRLADQLLPRGGGAGGTVDADLAAALDRISSGPIAGPTPAVLGMDIFGQGPPARSFSGGTAEADAQLDLAADTQLAHHVDGRTASPVPEAGSTENAASRQASASLDLRLAALEPPAARLDDGASGELDLGSVDASLPPGFPSDTPSEPLASEAAAAPAEPLRPFVRGRGAERRRTPSRLGAADAAPQAPVESGEQDAGIVPRAAEPASRQVADFELLTRPAGGRPPFLPVIAGIAAGLIVGLAVGYWLGSRGAAPASEAPARAVTSGRPAPAAAAPTEALAPAGGAATATPQTAGPASPAPSVPLPASAERSSRPPSAAAAVRGTIRVTASQQANVDLDGERKGMTPRDLTNVPLGSHSIRVTRPGYAPEEQTVVLTAEEPSAVLQFTLRRAGGAPAPGAAQAPAAKSVLTVLIESTPPGARIRVDGRDLGPAPLLVRQMRPGTHTLELRMPGYKTWTQRLTVAAGDSRRIMATLERDTPR